METMNSNRLNEAEQIVSDMCSEVMYVKKDKGLIERNEMGKKVILVEDNRQVLFG